MKKLDVLKICQDGAVLGFKNVASIIGAVILWLITIWIPYLNVGTTIAIQTMPLELAKGNVINPLFIFDAKYRKFMGEFFTLVGMMLIALIPAYLFMVVPAIVIGIGWSIAVLLLLDKGMAPGEAMINSTKLTYGNKWSIFFINFFVYLIPAIIFSIFAFCFGFYSFISILVYCLLFLCYVVIINGCNALIYKELTNADTAE